MSAAVASRSISSCSRSLATAAPSIALPARRSIFNFPFRRDERPAGTTSTKDGITYYHERKILPYTQAQLYAVVADVDAYTGFIPMCTSSQVIEAKPYGVQGKPWLSTESNHGAQQDLRAQLKIGFMGMEEAYISHVTCRRPDLVKAIAEPSSLLRHLSSTWAFQPASSTSPHPTASGQPGVQGKVDSVHPTLVSFDLAYQFGDPIQQAAAGAFFDRISSKIMSAFEQRCIALYGAQNV